MHAQVHLNRSRKLTRRTFLPIVAACSTLAGSASDDEAVWAQYLAWLKGRAGSSGALRTSRTEKRLGVPCHNFAQTLQLPPAR